MPGTWTRLRGMDVLQLGSADYVKHPTPPLTMHDPILVSVNGDNGDAVLPFGVRWSLNGDDLAAGKGSTATDAIAMMEFRLRGLL